MAKNIHVPLNLHGGKLLHVHHLVADSNLASCAFHIFSSLSLPFFPVATDMSSILCGGTFAYCRIDNVVSCYLWILGITDTKPATHSYG